MDMRTESIERAYKVWMPKPSVTAESVFRLFRFIAGREGRRNSGESARMVALLSLAEELAHNHPTMTDETWDAAVRVGGLLLRAEQQTADAESVATELLIRLRRGK
ncbi:conserved protein of unknown function [Burkholderia multivorans]